MWGGPIVLKKLIIVLCAAGSLGAAGLASAQSWGYAGAAPLPAGAVSYFALPTCPSGWIEPAGQAISQSQSPTLYQALGGRLPDLRGVFIRSLDNGRNIDPGRKLASEQTDDIKTHSHGLIPVQVAGVPAGGTGVPVASTNSFSSIPQQGMAAGANNNGGASETRPRNVALQICIKL